MANYNELTRYLESRTQDDFYLSYNDIEKIIGTAIPDSYIKNRRIEDERVSRFQMYAHKAGFVVANVDYDKQLLHFVRNNCLKCGIKYTEQFSSKETKHEEKKQSVRKTCFSNCPPKIAHVDDPYVLDYIEGTAIPALTAKNRNFIEAVVGLDSNYGKDSDINSKPDAAFDPNNMNNSQKKYCGSTAYWFNEMNKQGADFERCLKGAIIAIDRVNSTHLEASENGRQTMFDIINEATGSVDKLKTALEINFLDDKTDKEKHLIGLMSIKMKAKGKPSYRRNVSFATKFCAYASAQLGCTMSYSKYDRVVSSHLYEYIEHYLGEKVRKNEFDITSSMDLKQTLSTYSEYATYIERILNQLSRDNLSLSKSELDHIIWYGFKGRE